MSELINLENGISVKSRSILPVDHDMMKTLYESGVPEHEISKHFKIQKATVRKYAIKFCWLRPTKVKSMRKALAVKQRAALERTGRASDVNEMKASIWEDRREFLREQTFDVVRNAICGVTEEVARGMIKEAKDLKTVVETARLLTGEDKADERPSLAVNIAFLRAGVVVEDV